MREHFTILAHESTHSFGGFVHCISVASTTILRIDSSGRSILDIEELAKVYCHLNGRGEQLIVNETFACVEWYQCTEC